MVDWSDRSWIVMVDGIPSVERKVDEVISSPSLEASSWEGAIGTSAGMRGELRLGLIRLHMRSPLPDSSAPMARVTGSRKSSVPTWNNTAGFGGKGQLDSLRSDRGAFVMYALLSLIAANVLLWLCIVVDRW